MSTMFAALAARPTPAHSAIEMTDGIGHPAGTILYEDCDGNTHCIRPTPASGEG
jgi:hypothetical protein